MLQKSDNFSDFWYFKCVFSDNVIFSNFPIIRFRRFIALRSINNIFFIINFSRIKIMSYDFIFTVIINIGIKTYNIAFMQFIGIVFSDNDYIMNINNRCHAIGTDNQMLITKYFDDTLRKKDVYN